MVYGTTYASYVSKLRPLSEFQFEIKSKGENFANVFFVLFLLRQYWRRNQDEPRKTFNSISSSLLTQNVPDWAWRSQQEMKQEKIHTAVKNFSKVIKCWRVPLKTLGFTSFEMNLYSYNDVHLFAYFSLSIQKNKL